MAPAGPSRAAIPTWGAVLTRNRRARLFRLAARLALRAAVGSGARPAHPPPETKGLSRVTTSVAARRAARALPPWPADRPLRSWQERALATVARFDGRSFL